MQITVKLFARFKELAQTGSTVIETPENATISRVIEILRQQYPQLTLTPERTLLSVNQAFATPETTLKNGDEVAIFPPVSGGTSAADKFVITDDPISIDATAQLVTHPHTGAVATFGGMVRDNSQGKAVSALEYEAYHGMAIETMKQVAAEARQQWPEIVDIAIVQRIGHLTIGELSVAIAVSSAHRNQGCFEACKYSIDRLKEIVPIWKKEIGPDGESWIEGDYNPSMQQ